MYFFWAVLGVQNWKRIFEKTRVGFGRTELSLRLSCTEFCALSSGHGLRGRGFEGRGETLDVHDFLGGSKMQKNMKMQDEHGQILVSGALDPRKMISPKIPRVSSCLFSPKAKQLGKHRKTKSK